MECSVYHSYVELFPRSHLYNTPSQLRKMLKDYCLRPEKIRGRDIQEERQCYKVYLWEQQKAKWNNILPCLVCSDGSVTCMEVAFVHQWFSPKLLFIVRIPLW